MKKQANESILKYALIFLFICAFAASVSAQITVDRADDTAAASACTAAANDCSLRGAFAFANANGGTTINIPAGNYNLSLGELQVGGAANLNTTIAGAGAGATVITQTQPASRVINVNPTGAAGVVVSISGVTVTGGKHSSDALGGAGIRAGGSGNTLNLSNCVVTNNTDLGGALDVIRKGGGLAFTGGNLNVNNCVFSNNFAQEGGGLDYRLESGTGGLTITNSTFTANQGANIGTSGGGIKFVVSTTLAPRDVNISNNTFTDNVAVGRGAAIGGSSNASVTVKYNRFFNNTSVTTGSGLHHDGTGAVDATQNWWGCNAGPGDSTCSSVSGTGISFQPRIVLTFTAAANPVVTGQTTILTASFLRDSNNNLLTAANVSRLVGLPVNWTSDAPGNLSAVQNAIQANGTATANFTANAAGFGNIFATADNETGQQIPLVVNRANTTVMLTGDAPDPTVAGQSYTVSFNLTVNAPGSAIPTAPLGSVTISDGSRTCTASLPATSCNLISITSGTKTLTAVYNGDSNFNASPVSAGISHTVNQASTTAVITSINPSPSNIGAAVEIRFSINPVAPSTLPPPGNATVSDGVNSCTGQIQFGRCTIVFNTPGTRNLTVTFVGDAGYAGSTSPAVSHTVLNCPNPVVTNLDNSGAGSLRQIIADACDGSTITFSVTGTIILTSEIVITKDLTIQGPGADLLTVSGNQTTRVFVVNNLADSNPVTINDLTVTRGRAAGNGGGIQNNSILVINNCVITFNATTVNVGGGIFSQGVLTVRNSVVSENSANTFGGGIYITGNQTTEISGTTFSGNEAISDGGGLYVFDGAVTVNGGNFQDNHAFNGGGAIYNNDTLAMNGGAIEQNRATNGAGIRNGFGTLTLDSIAIQNNTATGDGGGIFNSASLNLTNSTISSNTATGAGGGIFNKLNAVLTGSAVNDNSAARGGGIYSERTLTLTNSTVSDNQANGNTAQDGGGGIFNGFDGFNSSTVTMLNATIAGNTAVTRGGGIRNLDIFSSKNTIFAQNTAPNAPDFDGGISSDGFNLIGNTSGALGFIASDLQNVNPMLGALADNGGDTQTRALLAGSPAINAGTNTGAPNTDQRGLSRPMSGTTDIGAFEVNTCGSAEVSNTNDSGAGSLRCAIAATFTGGVVNFNLPANSTITVSSEILIDKPMFIDGTGVSNLTISGGNSVRVFRINAPTSINVLNIAGGRATDGGAILNNSTLSLFEVGLSNNAATNFGGAIFNSNGANLEVQRSTFNTNSAVQGGAIYNADGGVLRLVNSTISGNTAGEGGGIFTQNTVLPANTNIINATIAGNTATGGLRGGGINGTATLKNTIIATNTGGTRPDVFGTFASNGFNLIGNPTGGTGFIATDLQNVNPMLGVLGDNGGATQTMALLTGSPAIDKGGVVDVSFATLATLDTDQRGSARPSDNQMIPNAVGGNGSDIGAFEEQIAPSAAEVSVGGRVLTNDGRGVSNAIVVLTDANGNSRRYRTSSFGYYRFDNVEVGQTYVVQVASKRFVFAPQVVAVNDELNDLNFIAAGAEN